MKIKYSFNGFLGNFSYYHRLKEPLNKPKIFSIETTNRCQLHCKMCPRQHMTRKIGDMEFSLFSNIIENYGDFTNFLWLHDFGDPLLHPDIGKLVSYAGEKGIQTGISTNALALNEKKANEILESKLDYLLISFDGINKEIYEKIRCGSNYNKVKRNIDNFLKLKKNNEKPYTYIQIIEMKETEPHIESFKEQWNPKADEVKIKRFRTFDGSIKSINELGLVQPPSNHEACSRPWTEIVILWDGRVVPCCYDYDAKYVLGDLNESSLKEIWNGQKAIELREQHASGKRNENPLCGTCSFPGNQSDWKYPFSRKFFGQIKREVVKKLIKKDKWPD